MKRLNDEDVTEWMEYALRQYQFTGIMSSYHAYDPTIAMITTVDTWPEALKGIALAATHIRRMRELATILRSR